MPKRAVTTTIAPPRLGVRYSEATRRALVALRESATAIRTAAPVHLVETPTFVEAPTVAGPGRLLVQLIKAGWNVSGSRYYPADVLERDASAFPAGTLNFVDHATDEQDEQRPEGSLKDLASVQTSAAYWDSDRQALLAEVRLFAPWREAITDMAPYIGMSIRADGMGEFGEAEGRQGLIISSIIRSSSVDYVTRPGAGGGVLKVLESTRLQESGTIGAWLESRLHLALTQYGDDMYGDGRLTRPERITLSTAIGDGLKAWTARVEADAPQLFQRGRWDDPGEVDTTVSEAARLRETSAQALNDALNDAVRDAYGGDGNGYVWVRDYDPDRGLVWYDASTGGECTTWQQAYTATGNPPEVTLGDTRIAVVAQTVYTPAPAEPEAADVTESAPAVAPTNVPDGAPPTEPAPTIEGSSGMTAPNTGPAPGQAGTSQTADTPSTVQPAIDDITAAARTGVTEAALADANARNATLLEATRARAASDARAEAAERELRGLRADAVARATVDRMIAESPIAESMQGLVAPRIAAQVVGRVPLNEAGEVDQTALEAAVTAAITAERTYAAGLMEAQGVGTPRGLGGPVDGPTPQQRTEDRVAKFKALGMSESAAKLAAAGSVAGVN
jgi:hypothetical protein